MSSFPFFLSFYYIFHSLNLTFSLCLLFTLTTITYPVNLTPTSSSLFLLTLHFFFIFFFFYTVKYFICPIYTHSLSLCLSRSLSLTPWIQSPPPPSSSSSCIFLFFFFTSLNSRIRHHKTSK